MKQPFGAYGGFQGNANHEIPHAHYSFGQVNWGNDRINALFAGIEITNQ